MQLLNYPSSIVKHEGGFQSHLDFRNWAPAPYPAGSAHFASSQGAQA